LENHWDFKIQNIEPENLDYEITNYDTVIVEVQNKLSQEGDRG
jgi:hypothetical protein